MKPKLLPNLLLIFILVTSCIFSFNYFEKTKADVTPKFYVDDDYNSDTPGWGVDHFDSIQDAINEASSGDRILVYEGTYSENLIINSTKTYIDLFGEDKAGTIINGGGVNDVIIVNASNIDISTLTIKNSGSNSNNSVIKLDRNSGSCVITDCVINTGQRGIFVTGCNNNIIYANTITSNNGDGIYLNNSNNNNITYCTINSNSNGIFAYNSDGNTISYCDAKSNSQNGIYLNATSNSNTISYNNISINTKNGIYFDDHCDSNTISNNQIHSNSYSGIRLENSSSNTLGNNVVNSNTIYGAMIVGSSNSLHNSTLNSNEDHGVFLFGDDNTEILDNTISRNTKEGILLQNSTSDAIRRNTITYNSRYGIYLNYYAVSNQIYNNLIFRNSDNARDISKNQNTWYTTKTSATNIVGGTYIYGNYWSNYDEISDGALDSDDDGIADNAKTINISSSDIGPLLDTAPPIIGTPSVTPSSQAVGSYTYISTTVTDNIEIKEVRLLVTDPTGQTDNFSIIQNKTGNTYYCNKIYSTIGDYSFNVIAKDPRNWATSSTGSFSIHAGEPPSITDNSPTTGSPGQTFTFNATIVSSDTSVSNLTAKVNWNHDTSSGNTSMVNVAENYFEISVTLDSSIEDLNYYFYAVDQWGNAATSETTTVTIADTQAPVISIERYGSSFDDLPNSFTFAATVTDDSQLSSVTIEYWYDGSEKMTADMENTAGDYYQKVIVPTVSPDRVYCVIYANDTSGNQADTKKPYAAAGGSYTGYIVEPIVFNGTNSFDLDGDINQYYWNFGDGNTGNGSIQTHAYSAKGTYTVTLTVTDNDDNINSDIATVSIIELVKITGSSQTINDLETEFNITLDHPFSASDTDGDGKVDKFVDPNDVIVALHSGNIIIDNHASFLLSVNSDFDKLFIWDAEADSIINATHQIGAIIDDVIDYDNNERVVTVEISKADWTYFEITDSYTDASGLTVKRSDGSIISQDMIWRESNKVYVLDDPDTTYIFIYTYDSPIGVLENAVFSPSQGSTINENNPTITITYNVNVDVLYAVFYRLNDIGSSVIWSEEITNNIVAIDYQTYSYTPAENLENGKYYLEIDVKDSNGNIQSDEIFYYYESYTSAGLEAPATTILILIGGTIGAGFILFYISKKKQISFESYIYFKNKKIIPFFKPLIFGPLRINLDDKKISKAEFYVNGKLKKTVDKAPFVWTWNEPAFFKQKIETKIFDEDGNSNSSGDMAFYMFNLTKPPK